MLMRFFALALSFCVFSLEAGAIKEDILESPEKLLVGLYEEAHFSSTKPKELSEKDRALFSDLFEKYIKDGSVLDVSSNRIDEYQAEHSVMLHINNGDNQQVEVGIHWRSVCGIVRTDTFTHYSIKVPGNDEILKIGFTTY